MRLREDTGSYWTAVQAETAAQAAVTAYLQTRLITFGGTGSVTTTATRTGTSPKFDPSGVGGTVDVVVTYTHTYLALPKFLGWGNTINIAAETIMRLE